MKKTYTIDGMHCKACELLVKKSLSHDIKNCSVDSANHKT
ncbi:MAG: heavy-metal-associated domain-containing protein [Candidatus Peribacteria bacterium]|nr:MAG: heavy-metal-associated domain-containing protein [Candidatus Peribacteria bacterium]